MNSPDQSPTAASQADESTGVPGLRTWPVVYLLVFISFAVWVGLLLALERFFS
jgi:hypothetical protein